MCLLRDLLYVINLSLAHPEMFPRPHMLIITGRRWRGNMIIIFRGIQFIMREYKTAWGLCAWCNHVLSLGWSVIPQKHSNMYRIRVCYLYKSFLKNSPNKSRVLSEILGMLPGHKSVKWCSKYGTFVCASILHILVFILQLVCADNFTKFMSV